MKKAFDFRAKIPRIALQCVIKTTQSIIGTHPLSTSDVSEVRSQRTAKRILKDNTQPRNSLSTLLPPGKWYRSIHCHNHLTPEQLLSSGCETLVCSPPK
ncbi:hypothetical protein L3Q82_012388, partial [Scortum barcoo]